MNRIAKFLALGPDEKRLFIEAWTVLAAMHIAVRAMPLQRLIAFVSRPRAARSASRPDVQTIVRAVERASIAIPGGRNCLVRALAAELMLRRAGHDAELRIGVANAEADVFKAHAWVEVAGKPVIGEFESGEYATLARPAL